MKDTIMVSVDLFYKMLDAIGDESIYAKEVRSQAYREKIFLNAVDIDWMLEGLRDEARKYKDRMSCLKDTADRIENLMRDWEV